MVRVRGSDQQSYVLRKVSVLLLLQGGLLWPSGSWRRLTLIHQLLESLGQAIGELLAVWEVVSSTDPTLLQPAERGPCSSSPSGCSNFAAM